MDGGAGGMDDGGMGGTSGDGSSGTNGKYGIGMERSDDDSATATLQSMGYVDDETKMAGVDGDSTDSGFPIIQSIFLVLVAVLGVYVVYSAVTGILAMFGLSL